MIPIPKLEMSLGHRQVLSVLANQITSYLEIGVREGGSLLAVANASNNLRNITLIDDWSTDSGGTGRGNHDHIIALLAENGFSGLDVVYHDMTSKHAFLVPGDIDGMGDEFPLNQKNFDLTHIDGSHETLNVIHDLQHVWPITNWAMVVHDFTFIHEPFNVFQGICEWLSEELIPGYTQVCFGDSGTAVFFK